MVPSTQLETAKRPSTAVAKSCSEEVTKQIVVKARRPKVTPIQKRQRNSSTMLATENLSTKVSPKRLRLQSTERKTCHKKDSNPTKNLKTLETTERKMITKATCVASDFPISAPDHQHQPSRPIADPLKSDKKLKSDQHNTKAEEHTATEKSSNDTPIRRKCQNKIGKTSSHPQSQTIIFKPHISVPTVNRLPQHCDVRAISPPPAPETQSVQPAIAPPPPPLIRGLQPVPTNLPYGQTPAHYFQPPTVQSGPMNVHQSWMPAENKDTNKGASKSTRYTPMLASSSSTEALMKAVKKKRLKEKMKRGALYRCQNSPPASSGEDFHEAIWQEINSIGKKLDGKKLDEQKRETVGGNVKPSVQTINNRPAVINIRNVPGGSQPVISIREEEKEKRLEKKLQEVMREELQKLRELKSGGDLTSQSKPNVHFNLPPDDFEDTRVKPILKKRRDSKHPRGKHYYVLFAF